MKNKKDIARFLLKPALEALGGPCREWRGKVRLFAHDLLKEEVTVLVAKHIKGCDACRLFYLDIVELKSSFIESVERSHATAVGTRSRTHYWKAERFKGEGVVDEAIAEYRKAIDLDSKNIDAYLRLAEIFNSQGKYVKGLEIMKEAVHLNLTDYMANLYLRGFLKLHGKLGDGITVWRKVYNTKPRTDWAYEFLGKALESNGQFKEAIHIYQEAVAKNDDAFAHELLADAYVALAMPVAAIIEYRKAIERDKNNLSDLSVYYKIKLSRALISIGNYKEAEVVSREVVAAAPGDYSAHASLADSLRIQGKTDEAISAYNKALTIAPESDWARRGLAAASRIGKKGKSEELALSRARDRELVRNMS